MENYIQKITNDPKSLLSSILLLLYQLIRGLYHKSYYGRNLRIPVIS